MQIVGLEEGAKEIGEDDLQVLETDVLADPQAFALVKHRRMRGIAVHAVGAAWRNHANLGHRVDATMTLGVSPCIANLHR